MNARRSLVYEDVCPALVGDAQSVCRFWQAVPTCSLAAGEYVPCSQPWRDLNLTRREAIWDMYPNQRVYGGGRPYWWHRRRNFGLHHI